MSGSDNALVKVVDSVPAVPDAFKPGLTKGLSYLLGGLAHYLGAWLRRPVQAVEDRTDARTLITQAVAEAAAEKLSNDPDVVAAAIANWGPADLNRQVNKMKIARAMLQEFTDPDDFDTKDEGNRTDEIPTDDFLNGFERFCSDASDEKMQLLWARLLVGEIKVPGTYSRQAMRCLYELDQDTATLFERIARKTVGGVLLATREDITTAEINKLQASGLITGGGAIYNFKLDFNEIGLAVLPGRKSALLLKCAEGRKNFPITSYPLSTAGSQLLSLLKDYDERGALIELANALPNDVVPDISLQPFDVVAGEIGLGHTEILRGNPIRSE